ncbi:hypothetical protein SU69_04420 [Thermosipho melanesiensis]|nr:hypothetical protein SU68_04475 [Thermosipho melanesiensis]OOC38463.1 hypothetical protein SU69_04420 [Thermosipho melanesiensis]OOC38925.1 hypothetical protein SU70_04420 [Thermosipho melanesiensis]OOC41563.1 hypothetical protein SU71_04410 [Thermosipho melanesiensis]OOC44052.1 hypothetical protein SU72_04415 [Thermosipho melanesiensis]
MNCDVDIWKFEELLKNKSDISEILGIYTGPFFPSINCIWANKMRMYYQKIIKKIVENYLKKEHIDIETLYKILRVFPELSTSELLEEPI